MRMFFVTIALLAVSSAAYAARPQHHASKKPAHQAVRAERHVAPKAKETPPADDTPAPSAPAKMLPYDAFRA